MKPSPNVTFRHKISICRKEAKETKYWLRMIAKAAPLHKSAARALWREAKELHLIFCAAIRTTDQNLRKERLTP
jgi:four helix bundle protein